MRLPTLTYLVPVNSEEATERIEPENSTEHTPSRAVLITKAAGLLVVLVIVGATLLLVLWLLVTIIVSLIASL